MKEIHESCACVACIKQFIGRHDMSYVVDATIRGRCYGCGRDDVDVHPFTYRYPWPDELRTAVCHCCGLRPSSVTVTLDADGRRKHEPARWCRHCYDREVQHTLTLLQQKVAR